MCAGRSAPHLHHHRVLAALRLVPHDVAEVIAVEVEAHQQVAQHAEGLAAVAPLVGCAGRRWGVRGCRGEQRDAVDKKGSGQCIESSRCCEQRGPTCQQALDIHQLRQVSHAAAGRQHTPKCCMQAVAGWVPHQAMDTRPHSPNA
jgi:hypothetical protein